MKVESLSDNKVHLKRWGSDKAIVYVHEDVREAIKKLKEVSGTTHSCYDKRCSCYNKKREDQNCWVIDKEDFDKIFVEELI